MPYKKLLNPFKPFEGSKLLNPFGHRNPQLLKKQLMDSFVQGLSYFALASALFPLLSILIYIVYRGYSTLNGTFFTELPAPMGGPQSGGMANALVGSCLLVAMAFCLGAPLGVLGGVYLYERQQKGGILAKGLSTVVDILNSTPSIVIGLFVYTLLVLPLRSFSAYAGATALALILLPMVIRTTEESLKLNPYHLREAGLSLGLFPWQVLWFVLIRNQLRALVRGLLLGLARIMGETAPLLFTAFGTAFWFYGLKEPIPSLPVQIYQYAISPYEEWHQQAWTGALVLLLLVFFLQLFCWIFLRQNIKKNTGR